MPNHVDITRIGIAELRPRWGLRRGCAWRRHPAPRALLSLPDLRCGFGEISPSVMNCTRQRSEVGDRAGLYPGSRSFHRDAGVVQSELGAVHRRCRARSTGRRQAGPARLGSSSTNSSSDATGSDADTNRTAVPMNATSFEIAQRVVLQRLRPDLGWIVVGGWPRATIAVGRALATCFGADLPSAPASPRR
jgi:hypothetical protein